MSFSERYMHVRATRQTFVQLVLVLLVPAQHVVQHLQAREDHDAIGVGQNPRHRQQQRARPIVGGRIAQLQIGGHIAQHFQAHVVRAHHREAHERPVTHQKRTDVLLQSRRTAGNAHVELDEDASRKCKISRVVLS